MSVGGDYMSGNPCGEVIAPKALRKCVICCKDSGRTYEVSSGVFCCYICERSSITLPIPYVCLNLEPWQVFETERARNGGKE